MLTFLTVTTLISPIFCVTKVMFCHFLVHEISNFSIFFFNLSFHRLVLVSGRRNSRRIAPMPDSHDNVDP